MSHNSVKLGVSLPIPDPHLWCKPVPYLAQQSDFSIPFPTDIYITVPYFLMKLFSLSPGSFADELKL